MYLEYSMDRKGVAPVRANPSDAGLDLFWNPSESPKILAGYKEIPGEDCSEPFFEEGLEIFPGNSVLLETGCKFAVPHGYCLKVENRSSIASRHQLLVGATIIDPGYEAEVFVNLINVGKKHYKLRPGDKIAQVVMYPVVHFRLAQNDELFDGLPVISNRGKGGFGSTDINLELKGENDG